MKKLALLALCLFLTGCWTTSNGQKIGTIVKLADEGILIKTHEGQLIRGGMNNGSGSFGHAFDFTIEDKNVLMQAEDAMNNQKEVMITYHKEFATLWRCESGNIFVDRIEILK